MVCLKLIPLPSRVSPTVSPLESFTPTVSVVSLGVFAADSDELIVVPSANFKSVAETL